MKLSQQMQVKSLDAMTGEFVGIAWAYGTDRTGDRIIKGAFNATIERLKTAGNALPLLWNHDQAQPIGSLYELEDTDAGLMVHGRLELSLSKAKEAYELLKQRVLSLSIGFMFDDQHAKIAADGVREFSEVDLFETSLVTVPANSGSTITTVKSFADVETQKQYEQLIRQALGLSRSEAKKLSSLSYAAMTQRDVGASDESLDADAVIKALSSATKSIQSI